MAKPDYGAEHRKLRRLLLASYVPGITPCWRCGKPITEWNTRRIHLGHDDDNPAIWRGLEHAACNTSAGASQGNKTRPPKPWPPRPRRRRQSRIW
jgi:hypothetical protein